MQQLAGRRLHQTLSGRSMTFPTYICQAFLGAKVLRVPCDASRPNADHARLFLTCVCMYAHGSCVHVHECNLPPFICLRGWRFVSIPALLGSLCALYAAVCLLHHVPLYAWHGRMHARDAVFVYSIRVDLPLTYSDKHGSANSMCILMCEIHTLWRCSEF